MSFHAMGLATLGRDATMGEHDGTAYARLSLAFTYGRKKDGKWPTQWAECTIWGRQATALEQYLKKGSQVSVVLEDVHIEEYIANDEKRTKLAARVSSIQLARGASSDASPPPPPAPKPAPPPPQRTATGFDDMDDDVPF